MTRKLDRRILTPERLTLTCAQQLTICRPDLLLPTGAQWRNHQALKRHLQQAGFEDGVALRCSLAHSERHDDEFGTCMAVTGEPARHTSDSQIAVGARQERRPSRSNAVMYPRGIVCAHHVG